MASLGAQASSMPPVTSTRIDSTPTSMPFRIAICVPIPM